MAERVPDELAPCAREEEERLRLPEELNVERSALAPGLLVAHVRRELRHRRPVDVVDGYPKRLERQDIGRRATDDFERIRVERINHQ
ncbi:MAG TPA: hypothetical protein VF195_08010 [Actinomycetota bacterium]